MEAPVWKISIEQYLEQEEEALEKANIITERCLPCWRLLPHNQLVGRVITFLNNRLRGKGCEAYPSDLRLHIPINTLFTYPDVMVICGQPEFWNGRQDTVLNPSLVVEVLSPGRADYDRGTKFMFYRQMASLQQYLMVSSTEYLVESVVRQGELWQLSEHRRLDEKVTLSALGTKFRWRSFMRVFK
ncbi:MAG: Uma2 family endonuclease [Cytophagales bacterium]|nr:Uma2 family endonuclease [Cytophagales bacterium]